MSRNLCKLIAVACAVASLVSPPPDVVADGFLNRVTENGTQLVPEKQSGLTAELIVTGPVQINNGDEAQMSAFKDYLRKVARWERDACELSRRLRSQWGPNPGDGKPMYFQPSLVGRHRFSDRVMAAMAPRPRVKSPPEPTAIPLRIRVTNTADKAIRFNSDLSSDAAAIRFKIEGAGAFEYRNHLARGENGVRPGKPVVLAPRQSLDLHLSTTWSGVHRRAGYWVLTRPGAYQLSATIEPGLLHGHFSTIKCSPVVINAIQRNQTSP